MTTWPAFKAYCVLRGDDPEAVDRFIDWARKHLRVWQMFEAIAYRDMQNGNRGDPMWTMGELRRRHKVSVPNSAAPGLTRMYNHKHRTRFFKTNKMTRFTDAVRERRAA